jgi:hypothetical protein
MEQVMFETGVINMGVLAKGFDEVVINSPNNQQKISYLI